MVDFLLGQQGGYSKYPFFICFGDSRAKERHREQKDWPVRKHLTVRKTTNLLSTARRLIFPPLHIKLGLIKQFEKALDTDGNCFKYLCESFPALSYEKIKAGLFDGLQTRQLMKADAFPNSMNETKTSMVVIL